MKHTLSSKKIEYDSYVRAQKEKEKDSKALKKLELQLKSCQESLININLQLESLLSIVSILCKLDKINLF